MEYNVMLLWATHLRVHDLMSVSLVREKKVHDRECGGMTSGKT